MKTFVDDKINVTKVLKIGLGRFGKIVRRGENAGYQHFLRILQCYQKPSVPGPLKVGLCGTELNQDWSIYQFFLWLQKLTFIQPLESRFADRKKGPLSPAMELKE